MQTFLRTTIGAALAGIFLSLTACGGDSDSSSSPITVSATGQPQALNISSTHVAVGGVLVVEGRSLAGATAFRIGAGSAAAPVIATSQTQTAVRLQMPAAPLSGTLSIASGSLSSSSTLVWTDTPFKVAVYQPMQLTSPVVAGAVPAKLVQLSGAAFPVDVHVRLGDRPLEVVEATPTRLTVRVDAPIGIYPLSLASEHETIVVAPQFAVVPPIKTSTMAVQFAAQEVTLTIQGEQLDRATRVWVGNVAARIDPASQRGSQLVARLTAPAAGEVFVGDAYQAVRAGSYSLRTDAAVAVDRVSLGQRYLLDDRDPNLALVAGQSLRVQAQMTTDVDGTLAPAVWVVASRGDVEVGRVQAKGPSFLVKASGVTPGGTFDAMVPSRFMQAGAALRVEAWATDGRRIATHALSVAVDPAPTLDLLVVPVRVAGLAPTVPDVASIRKALLRWLPLVDGSQVRITVRDTYEAAGLSATPRLMDVSPLLASLDDLRDRESPHAFVYGFVADSVLRAAGIGGIGYLNGVDGLRAGHARLTALGTDSALRTSESVPFTEQMPWWADTMTHEFGHVLTRAHAPCGGAAGADPQYPYAGGKLGAAPLIDIATGELAAPVGLAGAAALNDVMGYCGGVAFSDYNLRRVHAALQASSTGAALMQAGAVGGSVASAAPAGDAPWLQISGSIDGDTVLLDPLSLADRAKPGRADGRYTVVVLGQGGQLHRQAFDSVEVGDAATPGQAHFRARVPNPGALASIEIWRDGRRLRRLTYEAQTNTVMAATATATATAFAPSLSSDGAGLRLRWAAGRFTSATLRIRAQDGTSRVVLHQAVGGDAVVGRVPSLGSGERWELELAAPGEVLRLQPTLSGEGTR